MLKEEGKVFVIAIRDNNVILINEQEDHAIPNGVLENKEDVYQAGIRILEEETGLMTYEEGLFLLPQSSNVLVCRAFIGSIKSDQEKSPQWINLEKIDKINLSQNALGILKSVRSYMSL